MKCMNNVFKRVFHSSDLSNSLRDRKREKGMKKIKEPFEDYRLDTGVMLIY